MHDSAWPRMALLLLSGSHSPALGYTLPGTVASLNFTGRVGRDVVGRQHVCVAALGLGRRQAHGMHEQEGLDAVRVFKARGEVRLSDYYVTQSTISRYNRS